MTMFSKVIPLTEAKHLAQFFAGWQGQIEQISRGRFEGRLQVVAGRSIRVARVSFNQRVALRGQDSSGLTGVYPVIDRRSTNSWLGCRLRPNQMIVGGADHEVNHCSPKQTSDWSVHLLAEDLTDAARTLQNAEVLALPRTSVVYSAPPEAIAELMRPLTRILDMGLATPEFLESPECHALEQKCIRALVAALKWQADPPERLTFSARLQLVRSAEEFLRARLSEPIGMIDLCDALGANERTLRLAFREHYSVGPMSYLRILRLSAVRSRLLEDPFITIADAAQIYGFHHLGNFAGYYRLQFGERPSETIRDS